MSFLNVNLDIRYLVVLGPSRSLAQLGSVLARAFGKKAQLGSARLAISCKKSLVQLGLLYHLKNKVTLKNKK